MSAVPRPIRRRPAKRPTRRVVEISIDRGEFEGWEATAKADFAAKYLADLESGQISRIITVLDAIIVSHNFPNANDEIAQKMEDVEPWDGLMMVAGEIFDAIGKLPNR